MRCWIPRATPGSAGNSRSAERGRGARWRRPCGHAPTDAASAGAEAERAQLFQVRGVVAAGAEHDVVVTPLAESVQSLAGDLGRALEIAGIAGAVGARGRARQIHAHVGDHRALAPEIAEALDAVAERAPATPRAGADPAVELARGALDPLRAGPGADEHGWSAVHGGPHGRQGGARHALADPEAPHGGERLGEPPKARVEVLAEGGEVRGRGASAYSEAEASAGHEMSGEHALRQLHGMAQRHLEHASAQLDAVSDGGGHGQDHERVRAKRAAPDR